jgi:hypothetical protein
LRAQVQNLRQSGGGGLLLTATSDALAAADVQSMLKDLLEAGGAKLVSAQTLPVETRGNLKRVGVRISFSGDLMLLTGMLLGIESSHPVLAVGALELRSADDGQDGRLNVAMDIYGFRSQ